MCSEAEPRGKHSQAGAWERDENTADHKTTGTAKLASYGAKCSAPLWGVPAKPRALHVDLYSKAKARQLDFTLSFGGTNSVELYWFGITEGLGNICAFVNLLNRFNNG